MTDPSSPSMRNIRLHRPQPSAVRLDTSISGLLAGDNRDLHRAIVLSEDPRRTAFHQSNCAWNSCVVSHLVIAIWLY